MSVLLTIIFFLIQAIALGDITDLRVAGTTSTQAVLAYTAPSDDACTIKVADVNQDLFIVSANGDGNMVTIKIKGRAHGLGSGQPVFVLGSGVPEWEGWQTIGAVPNANIFQFASSTKGSSSAGAIGVLVNDINPAKFAASDTDNRAGNPSAGTARVFVIGKRVAEPGNDGTRYSRALQVNSTHYFTLSCAADTVTGSFQTANIPLGGTYVDAPPAAPDNPGEFGYQRIDMTRRSALPGYVDPQKTIDPLTGLLYRRMTAADDFYRDYPNVNFLPDWIQELSTNVWQNKAAVAKDDQTATTYSGTGQEWLVIRPNEYRNYIDNDALWYGLDDGADIYSLDWLQLNLKAWCSSSDCSSASDDDRRIEVCVTRDMVSCYGRTFSYVLPLRETAFSIPANPTGMQDWSLPGQRALNHVDVATRIGVARITPDSTLGSIVEIEGPTGGRFGKLSRYWVTGSQITIADKVYFVSKVISSDRLKLTTDVPGAPVNNVPWSATDFAFLLRKKTPSTHTISIQYANYSYRNSMNANRYNSNSRQQCSPVPMSDLDGNSGYLCVMPNGEGTAMMYWIDRQTGESRAMFHIYLPNMPSYGGQNNDGWRGGGGCLGSTAATFSSSQPNVFFCGVKDNSGKSVLLKITYYDANLVGIGPGAAGATAPPICRSPGQPDPCWTIDNISRSSQGKDLPSLIKQFDGRFDLATFGDSVAMAGIQSDDIILTSQPGGKDTIAWVAVFDTKKNAIIGSLKAYDGPCRWCLHHTSDMVNDSKMFSFTVANNYGNNFAGPWESTITSGPPTSGTSACAGGNRLGFDGRDLTECTEVTVDGEPKSSNSPNNISPAERGDYFLLYSPAGVEIVRLVARNGNTWTIGRHYRNNKDAPTLSDSPPLNHSGTAKLRGSCLIHRYDYDRQVFWDYERDPLGTNPDYTKVAAEGFSHGAFSSYAIIGNGGNRDLPLYDYGVQTPATVQIATQRGYSRAATQNPPFAGKFGRDGAEYYPAWNLNKAPEGTNRDWFIDMRPWGRDSYSPAGSVDCPTGPCVLVKFSNRGSSPWGLERKHLSTFAYCGQSRLFDISGPGSSISDQPADSYKYCVAGVAGECYPGSLPNDVFVNCPYLNAPNLCYGGNWNADYDSVCLGSQAPYVQGIAQIGFGKELDRNGSLSRKLGYAFVRNKLFSRAAKTLDDGSWLMVFVKGLNQEASTALLAKMPPYPAPDAFDRSTFIPLPLTLTPPQGAGVSSAVVVFGYAENGDPANYFCTSRQESCVAQSDTVDKATPFFFSQTEASSIRGMPCFGGCTVAIPALSQHVVYYQAIFRDSAGKEIARTPPQASVVP